ncbi:hypothetical protein EDEG_03082 [Edhazardia aedis USNM 41457]|uniref:Uncharacterized protein n=1 Tax=Edhazardia aedis (strain USNM 41457) TaxID=1003232 RepID=J9D3V2_EDHAE|nr:hypothetical protein EDEG_03082 [Edhazardia aedis USNM 41457]|eukprot:EJW02496.1 hypothetical protein EDEG_03082 [Edhazardia aedis USNM 41457]
MFYDKKPPRLYFCINPGKKNIITVKKSFEEVFVFSFFIFLPYLSFNNYFYICAALFELFLHSTFFSFKYCGSMVNFTYHCDDFITKLKLTIGEIRIHHKMF